MTKFAPIFLIIIAVLAGILYVRPQYEKIQALRVEAVQYENLLLQAQELKNIQAELEVKRSSFTPNDLNRLSKLVPNKVDTARLILDLNGVGAKYAIQMKNIQTLDPVFDTGIVDREKPYTASTVSFDFDTSYEAMVPFVRDLERSLRMVDVVDLSLLSNEDGSPFFKYRITLQAYWLNPNISNLLVDITSEGSPISVVE